MGKLRIRIESNGPNARDYRITNADTGETIDNVLSLRLDVDPNGVPTAMLELADIEVDVQSEAEVSFSKP